LLLAVAVTVTVLVYLDRNGYFTFQNSGDRRGSRNQAGRAENPDIEKYHNRTFLVTRSIDGDTFDINAGDGQHRSTRVRLIGVDTPEIHRNRFGKITGYQHYAREASDFTKRMTFQKTVRLELAEGQTRDNTDSRRLLAYVYLQDGLMLNRELVARGYGYADPRFGHRHMKVFKNLMRFARKNKNGLWKNPKDLPWYIKNK